MDQGIVVCLGEVFRDIIITIRTNHFIEFFERFICIKKSGLSSIYNHMNERDLFYGLIIL